MGDNQLKNETKIYLFAFIIFKVDQTGPKSFKRPLEIIYLK